MDLKGDQITVRELLSNPGAKKILERRFPAIMKSPMVAMAGDMKLSTVVSLAKGRVPHIMRQASGRHDSPNL